MEVENEELAINLLKKEKRSVNHDKISNYRRLIIGGIVLVFVDLLWVGSAELSDVCNVTDKSSEVFSMMTVSACLSNDLKLALYFFLCSLFFIMKDLTSLFLRLISRQQHLCCTCRLWE